jgi:hypothetical protein
VVVSTHLNQKSPDLARNFTIKNSELRLAKICLETYEDCIIFDYKERERGGEWNPIRDSIPLDSIPLVRTHPHFGGSRIWFVCPSCQRRCGVLWGRKYYRCRSCYRLTYESQYQTTADRLLERAIEKRRELGGAAYYTIDGPFPPKPKRMRWKTYQALRVKDDSAVAQFDAILRSFDKMR